jgi:hypothetical protein
MHPLARVLFLVTALVALLPGDLARATPAPANLTPEKKVILTWRAVAFESNQDNLFVKSEGRELPLLVPAFGVSKEYRYSGPNPITIYRKPAPPSEGKPAPTEPDVVASVLIDAEWSRALVFLFPKKDGTLIAHAVRSDDQHFSPGSLRIFNLVNQSLVLKIDGQDQQIGPGQEFQTRPVKDSRQIAIRYGLSNPKGVRWVGSNYFSVAEKGRTTVILTRTDSDYFRPVGLNDEVYPPKTVQAFSFSETAAAAAAE